MEGTRSAMTLLVFLTATMIAWICPAAGQNFGGGGGERPPCLTFADPCRGFLNNWYSQPSRECCYQVEVVINNQFRCVCSLYYDNRWSYWYQINYAKALQLPRACNVYFNLQDCPNPYYTPGGSGYQSPPSGQGSLPLTAPSSEAPPSIAPAPESLPPTGQGSLPPTAPSSEAPPSIAPAPESLPPTGASPSSAPSPAP